MAHSAKKKAEVVADVVAGLSFTEISKKHGIPRGTISKWAVSAKIETKPKQKETVSKLDQIRETTPAERQRAEFDKKLFNLLGASLSMLEAWAEQCRDPDFIQRNPEGVNELGRTVLERCDRIIELVRAPGAKPRE